MNAPPAPSRCRGTSSHRLDENQPFNMMRGTPYYRDAVYEQFSKAEYARRYAAIRAKMRAAKARLRHRAGRARATGASAAACCGSPAIGNGTRSACYVVVPLEGEPTLIYSMGGTHAEAVRRDHVGRALRRARQPRRAIRGRDGRSHQGAEARARPHRPARNRPAPQGLPAGQSVQRAARGRCPTPSSCSRTAGCTSFSRCTAPKSSTASAAPASSAKTR